MDIFTSYRCFFFRMPSFLKMIYFWENYPRRPLYRAKKNPQAVPAGWYLINYF